MVLSVLASLWTSICGAPKHHSSKEDLHGGMYQDSSNSVNLLKPYWKPRAKKFPRLMFFFYIWSLTIEVFR